MAIIQLKKQKILLNLHIKSVKKNKKILTRIYTLAKKENYDPDKVFGYVRREQLKAAA